jgi:hypothetical protein
MEKAASRGEELPMATDDSIRASDVDREAVVTTLREAYTAGRLTLDEFDERMTAAYASKTWGDLRALTKDLPTQPLRPEPREEPRPPVGPPPRRSPVAILIPVVIWTLLVVHGSAVPGVVFLLIAVFALVSIMASIRRR